MDLREHETHVGKRHPWERSRAAFFERVLTRHDVRAGALLDAGAGDGWTAGRLTETSGANQTTCWDIMYTDAQISEFVQRQPHIDFTRELPEGPFDLALMLDVIEHVEDDDAFLATVAKRLSARGLALVSVPAWPALFGRHDEFLKHYRRYRPKDAYALMERGGFEIVESGGLFHSLLPVRAAQIAVEKIGSDEPLTSLGDGPKGWMNEVITRALVAEQSVSFWAAKRKLRLPGLSWWCIARRR